MKNLITLIALFLSTYLLSHGGGLNKDGCHNDNKSNSYHCHRSSDYAEKKASLEKKNKFSEKIINKEWCDKRGGITEYRTKDGTFVDCLTDVYAIEAEFDNNWKESIGQSLHYAETTNRKAAILLIKRKRFQNKYYEQLKRVKKKYQLPIKVFLIEID